MKLITYHEWMDLIVSLGHPKKLIVNDEDFNQLLHVLKDGQIPGSSIDGIRILDTHIVRTSVADRPLIVDISKRGARDVIGVKP